MKNFWALPAFLRIALAGQHAFSVFDDLLAFPQYEVVFPNSFITEDEASSLLSHTASRSTSSATSISQETQELSKPIKQASGSTPHDATLDETYEAVVVGDQRYLCSIPSISDEEPQNSTTSAEQAKAEEERELVRATERGWELLDGMRGNCIYYLSGWWSYSFCYNNEVKQFHQLPPSRTVPPYPPQEDPSVSSFILGSFPDKGKKTKSGKEARKTLGHEEGTKAEEGIMDDEGVSKGIEVAKLETKGSTRYMVQRLSGGTECDLTGKQRKIEVQFHCHPQSGDKIHMIKETATCTYLMIVYTPRLCNDAAFLPPQVNLAHPISCQPVVSDADIEAWTAAKIDDKIAEAERIVALENENPLREMETGSEGQTKRRPVIGGIEVGAKALVGTEGKVIEKSVVVGGGKEVFIGTVATSDGKQMSAQEMKKHNIHDPKNVEKLKGDLRKLAGRKGWKLDLIDTPRGREFRGIIEVEEQEEQSPGSGSEGEKGKGMKKESEKGTDRGEEESEEGSEEVYKDEL